MAMVNLAMLPIVSFSTLSRSTDHGSILIMRSSGAALRAA